PVVGILGLDDLSAMHQHARPSQPVTGPNAALGSNCCHLSPNDLASFYDDSASYDGSAQTLVIAGAYAWRDSDNTTFSSMWGLPPLPAGSGQVCTGSKRSSGCAFSSQNSIEIALDVEYAHGTAPRARILNYMAASTPACAGYGSETGWSGSGGGVSQAFSRPLFQTGCSIAVGSQRLVPDVALEADTSPGNYVVEGGRWYIVGGTSGAAPQWAGFF